MRTSLGERNAGKIIHQPHKMALKAYDLFTRTSRYQTLAKRNALCKMFQNRILCLEKRSLFRCVGNLQYKLSIRTRCQQEILISLARQRARARPNAEEFPGNRFSMSAIVVHRLHRLGEIDAAFQLAFAHISLTRIFTGSRPIILQRTTLSPRWSSERRTRQLSPEFLRNPRRSTWASPAADCFARLTVA